MEGRTNKAGKLYRKAGHRRVERAGGRYEDHRPGSTPWRVRSDHLQLEGQVWRSWGVRGKAAAETWGWERRGEAAAGRDYAESFNSRMRDECWTSCCPISPGFTRRSGPRPAAICARTATADCRA